MPDYDLGSIGAKVTLDVESWKTGIGSIRKDSLATTAAITAMTTAITAKVSSMISKSIKLYATYVETLNLFNVTFEQMASSTRKWALDTGKQLGVTGNEMMEFSGKLKLMIETMGVSDIAATEYSKTLTQLMIDISSFRNVDYSEIAIGIQNAVNGIYRNLRRFGIVITAAEVQQRALKDSLKKTKEELTQQDLVTARIAIIQERFTKDSGDLLRTQYSLENQTRRLKTNFSELGVLLGQQISKVWRPTLIAINKVLEAIRTFSEEHPAVVAALGAGAVGVPTIGGISKYGPGLASAGAGLLGYAGVKTGIDSYRNLKSQHWVPQSVWESMDVSEQEKIKFPKKYYDMGISLEKTGAYDASQITEMLRDQRKTNVLNAMKSPYGAFTATNIISKLASMISKFISTISKAIPWISALAIGFAKIAALIGVIVSIFAVIKSVYTGISQLSGKIKEQFPKFYRLFEILNKLLHPFQYISNLLEGFGSVLSQTVASIEGTLQFFEALPSLLFAKLTGKDFSFNDWKAEKENEKLKESERMKLEAKTPYYVSMKDYIQGNNNPITESSIEKINKWDAEKYNSNKSRQQLEKLFNIELNNYEKMSGRLDKTRATSLDSSQYIKSTNLMSNTGYIPTGFDLKKLSDNTTRLDDMFKSIIDSGYEGIISNITNTIEDADIELGNSTKTIRLETEERKKSILEFQKSFRPDVDMFDNIKNDIKKYYEFASKDPEFANDPLNKEYLLDKIKEDYKQLTNWQKMDVSALIDDFNKSFNDNIYISTQAVIDEFEKELKPGMLNNPERGNILYSLIDKLKQGIFDFTEEEAAIYNETTANLPNSVKKQKLPVSEQLTGLMDAINNSFNMGNISPTDFGIKVLSTKNMLVEYVETIEKMKKEGYEVMESENLFLERYSEDIEKIKNQTSGATISDTFRKISADLPKFQTDKLTRESPGNDFFKEIQASLDETYKTGIDDSWKKFWENIYTKLSEKFKSIYDDVITLSQQVNDDIIEQNWESYKRQTTRYDAKVSNSNAFVEQSMTDRLIQGLFGKIDRPMSPEEQKQQKMLEAQNKLVMLQEQANIISSNMLQMLSNDQTLAFIGSNEF